MKHMPFHFFSPVVRGTFCAALAMALWPVGALAQSGAAAPSVDFIVAVVDASPITNHDVRQRALELQAQARQQGNTLERTPALLKDALEKLINERALLQLAESQGVVIDAVTLNQALERVAAQNQMSLDAWRKKLATEGTNVQRWQQNIKDQLTLQRLTERNVPPRIRTSDAEIDAVISERMQARANTNPNIELAHILIATPERASFSELSQLQARAQGVLQRLQSGESFASLAKEFSNSAEREQGGLMGLRPMDRYPTLFAETAEKLSVGELSPVLRSGAGFHILKLVSKQNSQTMTVTETRARHILLRPGGQLSQNAARAQLLDFKRQLDAGRADFAKLARDHSQDGSADSGGELGWVAPGVFVPEFEEVMNKLPINQISEPVISRFGVHLIQVLARREAPISERELRETARTWVRQRKFDETYDTWVQEVRGRAYIEYRDPPQ
jgi:peptidyl-prolyl cis-trans isomerase SurA